MKLEVRPQSRLWQTLADCSFLALTPSSRHHVFFRRQRGGQRYRVRCAQPAPIGSAAHLANYERGPTRARRSAGHTSRHVGPALLANPFKPVGPLPMRDGGAVPAPAHHDLRPSLRLRFLPSREVEFGGGGNTQ